MFCKNCGAQISDDAKFCGVCGASQQDAPQQAAPVNPNAASAAPAASLNLGNMAGSLKLYLKYILVVVAILALVLAIMNIFNTYDVKATYSYGGQKMGSATGPVKDLFGEGSDGEFIMALIGNILFGIVNLVIAVIGVLYFLKENNNMDLYDKFVASKAKGKSPLFVVGVLGAVAALVQIILYAMCKPSKSGVTLTIAAHWTSWVFLFVYALLVVVDMFVLNPKKK